jgi:nucleotide-binding universal stress UspA family protein
MKLLIAFDGSNVAKEAVSVAVKHAQAFGAGIELVWSLFKGTQEEVEDIAEAEKALAYREKTVRDAGVACGSHLLIRGKDAGTDLVDFAREQSVDLIYIGTRRRSKVGKLVFGSTTQYVILNAHCPVVTVK